MFPKYSMSLSPSRYSLARWKEEEGEGIEDSQDHDDKEKREERREKREETREKTEDRPKEAARGPKMRPPEVPPEGGTAQKRVGP